MMALVSRLLELPVRPERSAQREVEGLKANGFIQEEEKRCLSEAPT